MLGGCLVSVRYAFHYLYIRIHDCEVHRARPQCTTTRKWRMSFASYCAKQNNKSSHRSEDEAPIMRTGLAYDLKNNCPSRSLLVYHWASQLLLWLAGLCLDAILIVGIGMYWMPAYIILCNVSHLDPKRGHCPRYLLKAAKRGEIVMVSPTLQLSSRRRLLNARRKRSPGEMRA